MTWNWALEAPEERRAEKPPEPLPTVTWTSVTPSMPRSTFSTLAEASSVTERLVPAGKSCWTVTLFWPVSPSKLVGSRGVMAKVAAKMIPPARRVTTGCFCVLERIGR